jgi:hypothetical protein
MKEFNSLILFFFAITFLTFSLYVADIASKAYNTQKDREMFVKTYEMVVECRKNTAIQSADKVKVCGELPTFVNKVS